jgi:predicted nucleic acid-binding Zn ribbon protein
MPKFYCANCGMEFSSVRTLTSSPCARHPLGPNKGRHVLYEGSEKSEYTCKYCGRQFQSIRVMTASPCFRHPLGPNKGRHSPAL